MSSPVTLFQTEEAAARYDEVVYRHDSYDSFIWSLQRARLISIVDELRDARPKGLVHLDFACGTGRLLSAVEGLTSRSTGVDVSEPMLALARAKVRRAELVQGDLLVDDDLLGDRYDLITAFRFLLNAAPAERATAMAKLARRLREPDGRLIFNVQGNRLSLRHLGILRRRRQGESHAEMSLAEVRQLVEANGLEIESWYGFGVLPRSTQRWVFAPFSRWLNRFLAGKKWVRGISCDLLFVCRRKARCD